VALDFAIWTNSQRALRVDEGKSCKTNLIASVLRYRLNIKERFSAVHKGGDYNLKKRDEAPVSPDIKN